jgi:hypothetical protein
MAEMRNACKLLVGESEAKRKPRSPTRRWDDNIKMDLEGIGCEGVEWKHETQDRVQWQVLVNRVMNFRVP